MPKHNILLTGANGFLGSHILKQLLPQPDVYVRVVVRSSSKIEALKHDFGSYNNLDLAIVPDITAPDAFDYALTNTAKPFTAVIHTASPFLYKAVTSNLEFLTPAVEGTTGILKSIKAVAPSVKRVVVTSSFAAVGDLANPENMKGKVMTEDDWNPITWEQALQGTKGAAYQGSKKFAEQAAWDFINEEKPGFDLVTICPPMIYGPLAHTVHDTSSLNESTARIYNLFINSSSAAELPPDALYLYADPRDVAAAHVAAIMTPEAGNNRFIVCAGQVGSQAISDILRLNFPELHDRTPVGRPRVNSLPPAVDRYAASSEKAKRMLGITFRPLEETLIDLGGQMLGLEAAGS